MGLQHVREQVVVAIPAALVVERDDEEVAAVERVDGRRPPSSGGDRVARRPVSRQDRGLQQEAGIRAGCRSRTSSTR